jgi:predicted acetyltransferase
MALEIRTVNDDEIPQAVAISAYAFNAPNHYENEERIERAWRANQADWYLATFQDGVMTSMMVMLPVEMYLNGATIPLGAVSPVATAPEHRRKGHAGQMLRHSLQLMKERGQAISGLTTPHPALYRRYGWEIAADRRTYAFQPKDLSLTSPPKQRGRFEMLTTKDWQQLDELHRAYATTQNGPFARDEVWWREMTLNLPWRPVSDVVLWRNDAGSPEGYALYNQPTSGPDQGKVLVYELIALSGDAYKNIAVFFATHDMSDEIRYWSGLDDAFPLLFSATERIEIRERFTAMLRVCDFEAAMRLRPAARDDETCEVLVRIDDKDAPWNAGVWRVSVAEGRSSAERTQLAPELTIPTRMLAPLYNGYMKPSIARAAGLIEASSPETLVRADRVFAATQSPHFIDTF